MRVINISSLSESNYGPVRGEDNVEGGKEEGSAGDREESTPAEPREHEGEGEVEDACGLVETVVEVPWGVEQLARPCVVVDLTQHFNRIFVQTTFSSFKEFERLFNKFKAETGSVFRIKSSCSVAYENSRRKRHFIPPRFKFATVRYCCVHYGQPKVAGQGIRTKQRYLPCGCECLLSVSYNRGALVISQLNMQHNHEVSSEMAPFYAINRRITNSELRQVEDVIEMMPSSRALQQFLQEHFHRPTTLQDAKNIRARLKALNLPHLQSLSVAKTEKPDTMLIEEDEEVVDGIQADVEDLDNSLDEGDNHCEVPAFRGALLDDEQEQPQEHHLEQDDELEHARLREDALDEIKAQLSDLLQRCDASVFWERISIISKVVDGWESGKTVCIQYPERDIYSEEIKTNKLEQSQSTQTLPQKTVVPQNSCGKVNVNNSSHLAGSSSANMDFVLPELNGSDVQFLSTPASEGPQSQAHRENTVHSKGGQPTGRHRGRPRNSGLACHAKDDGGKNDFNLTSGCCGEASRLSTARETVDSKSIKAESLSPEKKEIILSIVKNPMCDQAVEVEIEVEEGLAKVREIKREPLEYFELDVSPC